MKKNRIFIILYFIIAAAIIAADQISKACLFGKSYSVLGDFLWVESSFNTGAAFSFLSGKVWLFVVVAVCASLAIIYFLFSEKWGMSQLCKISLSLVLGGALGNLIDRIVLGGVRDFIYLKSINFAIFNVADMAVCVGGLLFAVGMIIDLRKSNKKENTQWN